MYAYVIYKDGARAVVSHRLVRDFSPSSEKDISSGKNKMIYWREKKENGDGDLEDFFPGDVIELAESKQELARKVQKRRLRWPDHVFDDVVGVAPCKEELSNKERKKRKEVAKLKEMMAMTTNWPEDDEDGDEPEKDKKYARLEQEIISLRKKLAEERKRNRGLQDIVIKGMEKLLQKACCNHSCTNQQQKVPEPGAQGFCELLEQDWHAEDVGDDLTDSLQDTAPRAATPVPPPAPVAAAVAAPTPPPPPAPVAAPTPPPPQPAVLLTPPPPALTPVAPRAAMPLVAQPAVGDRPGNTAAQCSSEAETTQRNLGNGVTVSQEKWRYLMAQPKDSLFVREAAKAIWGIQNLYNRSITGTPCRRFLHKEAAGPSSVEKQALTPRKLDALRNAYEEHLKAHASNLPDTQRRRNMNRHLADLLKVLKK
ncbi:histone-lysine N-methyltransferase 2B [Rhipicephalus sanguineus]|uniref:histone-lysine N-methyltransferase 2B n=1 Tax=Rhipicephalus sanguineus TaxID=34632 RepID=UPI0018954BF5|nr:histone-lysine N-methyltransferase 2B [Rhipicephalus sanguineus]